MWSTGNHQHDTSLLLFSFQAPPSSTCLGMAASHTMPSIVSFSYGHIQGFSKQWAKDSQLLIYLPDTISPLRHSLTVFKANMYKVNEYLSHPPNLSFLLVLPPTHTSQKPGLWFLLFLTANGLLISSLPMLNAYCPSIFTVPAAHLEPH